MNASLIGPVWIVAVVFMLVAVGLSVYVLLDTLRPKRRASAAEYVPEPLWVYAFLAVLFLVSIILPQVTPGMSILSAMPVFAAPIAIIAGVTYLLRVVFPRDRAV